MISTDFYYSDENIFSKHSLLFVFPIGSYMYSIVDKSAQEDLLNDVDALQLAQSERIFTKTSNLFIKKWTRSQPDFVEYFR